MEETIVHENKRFSGIDYSEKELRKREFLNCEFTGCSFNKSNLSGNMFEDCTFTQCDLSMAGIINTGFRDVRFFGCKMMGLDFTRCSRFAFSFSFEECHLDYSTFFGTKLKKTVFAKCSLREVDFSEADLAGVSFAGSDLISATFFNSNLEKADFRTAVNFAIDPARNKMKKAKFSVMDLEGLLYMHSLDIDRKGS